jgi:pimeloyl-ACP methyl ester carboxylesterase
VSLALEERGVGPQTLLFAHGWISSRRMWYDVAERLDPDRYRSHLLDFRGCGLSDRTVDGHDLAGYASDLRAALEAVGPATIVAHSMGGKIAQSLAAERHRLVQRLILIAPGQARAVEGSEKHRALAEAAFGSRERIARFQRSAMTRPLGEAVLTRIVEDALIAQREHWFGWYDHGRLDDFADRLDRITVPTAVVAGTNDPLAPPSILRRDVVDRIAGSLFVNLRGAGHNLPIETPDEIVGIIERFAHLS